MNSTNDPSRQTAGEGHPGIIQQPFIRPFLSAAGPFIGLALVVGIFCAMPQVRPYFLTGANFKIIFTQTVVVAVAALGMTIIIVSGGIDLSVGSVIALTGVVGATLLVKQCPTGIVMVMVVLSGVVVGAVNGGLVAGFKMLPFIVTLGMMGIVRGTAKWLSDSQTVSIPETFINKLMAAESPETFFPLPPGVWLTAGLALAMTLVMRRTVFGRYVFAIGSNEAAARLSGIRVRWQKVAIYSLAGLFAGLAGLLQMSRLTQGDPTAAIGLELDVIAAVVIGGASLSGGSGSIMGSMIGALIMAVLRNGSNQMGLQTYMQEILIGVIIIIAVGLDKLRQRRSVQG